MPPSPTTPPAAREEALERELAARGERLDQLERLNAEYQGISEELQSANEALLASREELQAVNGELQTINGELAERLTELAHSHNQAARLLASTGIATVFVDNGERLQSFTPRAAELFGFTDDDRGRPVNALGPRIVYPEMEQDLRHVLGGGTGTERRIATSAGARGVVRVLPHRSTDDFLAGAVLVFLELD